MTGRRELTGVVATRYRASTGTEKREILDEFAQVTGFHRKYAIRVLNRQVSEVAGSGKRLRRPRIYDQAVQEALVVSGKQRIGFAPSGLSKYFRCWLARWNGMAIARWMQKSGVVS